MQRGSKEAEIYWGYAATEGESEGEGQGHLFATNIGGEGGG